MSSELHGVNFDQAVDKLVDPSDPAQLVYGHILKRAYKGIMQTKFIAVAGVGIEEVEVLEVSLETARKATDSLVRRKEAIIPETQTSQPIRIGFLTDSSLPDGVLDPYTEDEEG